MVHNHKYILSLSIPNFKLEEKAHLIAPAWFRIVSTPGSMSQEQASTDVTTRDVLMLSSTTTTPTLTPTSPTTVVTSLFIIINKPL